MDALRGINRVSAAKARGEASPDLVGQGLQPLADLPAEELARLSDVIERVSDSDH